VRHPVLFGEYELNLDEKNRLLIPSDVRRAVNPEENGDGFFLVIGTNRLPWLYPERYYEQLVTQAPADITPAQDLLAFDQRHFSMTSRVEMDKQGRILLPEKTLRRASLQKEVTLIGVRDHLELWNRADWEARREELERHGPEIALAAKRVRMESDKPV
jgi:MraZ protein